MITDDSVIMSMLPMISLKSEDSRIPRILSQMRKTINSTVCTAQIGLIW